MNNPSHTAGQLSRTINYDPVITVCQMYFLYVTLFTVTDLMHKLYDGDV